MPDMLAPGTRVALTESLPLPVTLIGLAGDCDWVMYLVAVVGS